MEITGRPTIHPFLFYTGKTAGYLTGFSLFPAWAKFPPFTHFQSPSPVWLTVLLASSGFIFIVISLIHLGKSVRIGLPTVETTLRMAGIYRISRNPMYVGLHLLTLSAMVYTLRPLIIFAGIFSFLVYHLIILGEEKFLAGRFGEPYQKYKHKVRRYL
jgi:protein-S-isoprenylcysteine O-methyltransferase Ste14